MLLINSTLDLHKKSSLKFLKNQIVNVEIKVAFNFIYTLHYND
jgi:hypothetical protein